MKELEKQFEGKGDNTGFKFEQLLKTDLAYLYETTDEYGIISYEVFERREQEASSYVIGGVTVNAEAKVLYPKTSAFGDTAFCFRDIEKAKAKFVELNQMVV